MRIFFFILVPKRSIINFFYRWRKVNRSAKIGLTNNKANSKINNLLKNLFDELGEKFLSDESRTIKMTKE